jgi:hypothetical protein
VARVEAKPERDNQQRQAASDITPALAITSASSAAAALPDVVDTARRSRRYWRRA